MVMNTFRSKLRRRRDELFRRGSDESDEWQFVPFNPSVYPAINNNTFNNNTNLNGRSCSGGQEAPPTPKPALRPWYLQRASWHEGHPPIPPHGHGSEVKGYFPLPPCPEPSPPPLPPHGHEYPGSVPPWYGAQFHAAPMQYPASVPPGQVRPSPVVLRRAARGPAPSTDDPPPPPPPPPITSAPPRPTSGGSRPNSGGSRPVSGGSRPSSGNFRGSRPSSGGSDIVDGVTISPEGPAPQVPPHGRPAVPPHISTRSSMSGTVTATAPVLPPPPKQPLPPPPVPAHAAQGPSQAHATHPTSLNISPAKPDSLNLEHLTPFLAPLLNKETSEAEQEVSRDSPEYKTPVDQSPEYKSPCDCSDCYPGEKGNSSVGGSSGLSNKEQRRSDPGSVTGVGIANHNANATNAATTNNAQTASTTTSTSTPGGDLPNNAPDTSEEVGALEVASSNIGSTEGASAAVSNTIRFLQSAWSSQSDILPAAKHSLQQPKKKSGTPVNRSESLKEKQHGRKRTRESRKHSDPNIPTSKSGDVDAESSHNFGTSGSSSNSSLSHSLESPSTSLEHVSRTDAPLPAPVLENDSDIEAEVDLPNWQKLVSEEEIKKLKPKERKRQETINELFHTERTHVRVLKVLKHLFQVPMTEAGLLPRDQLDILFPNMDQMLEIHTAFNQAMKKRRQEEPLVLRVGDLLINMFDGEQGDHFQQQAAEFLRTQFLALENLKQRQKRDQRLSSFLQEQENNPACRRLQLKDMLPAGFQRLSKYPLFMESLLAYTDSNTHPEEYEQISRALERAREILAYVNTAVQEAENSQRLSEIQRKLDQSSLAKNKHGHSDELKGNLDLTKHKLIYEGSLTWRIAKGQKNIDLLVLLLDEFIVLLQKADDKYILKNHSKSLGRDDNKLTHSPIVKYGPSMLFRAVATDNSAFFIVTTQSVGAQIYELVTSSPSERKVWFRHIQEAQEAYTARDGRNRRSHPQTPLQDLDDQPSPPPDGLRDVDDNEVDGADAAEGTIDISADTKIQQGASKSAEQIGKSEEPSSTPTTTPAAQPPASPETLAKKTAEAGGASSSSSGPGGLSPSAGRSPASGRRLQEVQIIQIVEGPTLIQPSEVKVSQGVVLSAEPVLTPIEHLRRKDLKIRQALEEKQHIIADILNIPHEHFENVVDMAGEPAVGNKEPRELVLAAMFQAKCLQETLNEALNISEGDIVAARANNDSANKATSLPLYQAPMTKLMSISTALSQQLSSLLNLVSERDDERERMRKELVASRERLHLLHMRQNSVSNQTTSSTSPSHPVSATSGVSSGITPPSGTSPHTSRPSSFVSVASSAADHSDTPDHHDTDEDGSEVPKINSTHPEEFEDSKEDTVPETYEDAVCGSDPAEPKSVEVEGSSLGQESCEEGRGCEGSTETITT